MCPTKRPFCIALSPAGKFVRGGKKVPWLRRAQATPSLEKHAGEGRRKWCNPRSQWRENQSGCHGIEEIICCNDVEGFQQRLAFLVIFMWRQTPSSAPHNGAIPEVKTQPSACFSNNSPNIWSQMVFMTLVFFQTRSELWLIFAWMIETFNESYLSEHWAHSDAKPHNQTILRGRHLSWAWAKSASSWLRDIRAFSTRRPLNQISVLLKNPHGSLGCLLLEVGHNCPILKWGLHTVTSFQRAQYAKRGKKH